MVRITALSNMANHDPGPCFAIAEVDPCAAFLDSKV